MEGEYFPLSTRQTDNDHHLEVGVVPSTATKLFWRPSSVQIRQSFILRTSAFMLMELSFIVLASLAITNPIPIHLFSDTTLTEAKGALTIISVLWHALAILAVKNIVLQIFSAEWIEQYRRSGNVVLGETDNVSRLTAGFLDHIKHFVSRKATIPFRLAFISGILLMGLNGLGPGAITINYVSHKFPLKIEVADLTLVDVFSLGTILAVDRADAITRLESVETENYGFYSQQTNILIPWPPLDLLSANKTMTYESDIIQYNFTCSWKQPTFNQLAHDWGWIVDGQEWLVHRPPILLNNELSDPGELQSHQFIHLINVKFSSLTHGDGWCA